MLRCIPLSRKLENHGRVKIRSQIRLVLGFKPGPKTEVQWVSLTGPTAGYASKNLGEKFATGASLVKGPTEKEQIDVQGDIAYDIVDFITKTWSDVPESAIFFIEDGKKVPAA
ncbi:hypothetical protein RND71_012454 [Anisodus tanguticus]|uniref:SUI1 domain-containing protein n=1 Tax=Anisodus tanguticus TaxID=243964 RepID=A0AAE1VGZ1_9SOLA|nr:hypothetical protein RND71_012454 [Anisodus tanguticus]